MPEIWKAIPGFEGLYEVSNQGRVRRILFCNGSGFKADKPPKILSPGKGRYLKVQLSSNNKRFQQSVHRLVLEAFVGLCPPGKEGSHKDGDRQNNNLNNLLWETRKINHSHKHLHGTALLGERCTFSKLKNSDIPKIRKLKQQGNASIHIAQIFGATKSNINKILQGLTWRHIK